MSRIKYPSRAIIPAQQIVAHIKLTQKIRTSFMVTHEGIYRIYFFVKDISASDEGRLLFIHEIGGQKFEESFKFKGWWTGSVTIYQLQCHCSRWCRNLFIMDSGRLGCQRCCKIRPPEFEPEHLKMSMIPNALLAYMQSAKTTQRKQIAVKCFQNYVKTMKRYIKRKPGKLTQKIRQLKEMRKYF